MPGGGGSPTNWVPDCKPDDTVTRSSLLRLSELQTNWDLGPMDIENFRAVTLALTIHLPLAFGWLVEDAKWAMGTVWGHQGHEWGDFLRRSGSLLPDAHERLMAAWLTWRELPIPSNLLPVVERVNQPRVPQPEPGTYGNAAVAGGGTRTAGSIAASATSSSSNL